LHDVTKSLLLADGRPDLKFVTDCRSANCEPLKTIQIFRHDSRTTTRSTFLYVSKVFATFFPCLMQNLHIRCSLSSDIPIAARNATRRRDTPNVNRSCSGDAWSFLAVHFAVQTGDSRSRPNKLAGPNATS